MQFLSRFVLSLPLPIPVVTWQFRFAQEPDGTWKAVSHR